MDSQANMKEVPFQEQFSAFAGFDWASDHHDVVVLDPAGTILVELRFADDAAGWADFAQTGYILDSTRCCSAPKGAAE